MTPEWSARALADLNRFAAFLEEHYPRLARIVAAELIGKAQVLAAHPEVGRPIKGRVHNRELTLQVLNAPYVFRYRFDGRRLVVLRVFHGRERRE